MKFKIGDRVRILLIDNIRCGDIVTVVDTEEDRVYIDDWNWYLDYEVELVEQFSQSTEAKHHE